MTQRSPEVRLATRRLILRPLRGEDAEVMRELWSERDERVPPHRRIDEAGNPSLEALRAQMLRPRRPLGLLAAEDRVTGEMLGYCGLIDSDAGNPGEPEIAFEFLRRSWGLGLATEAGEAVVEWARGQGIARLWATVWDWNAASRRVLDKLGFTTTAQTRVDPELGVTLFTTLSLES